MEIKNHKLSFVLPVIFSILLCISQPASAIGILDALGKFDASLSEFNPIGHYLVDPINDAVPRLHISGSLRLDTAINVRGKDHSVGVGKINKDWRAQKIEWLAELEATYRFNDNWELAGVTHFLYDSVYDWDSSRGLYADKTDRTSHYYHQGKQILRELYLKGFWGNFDIYLGKQQVVWGKMEGRVLDIINPMDSREYAAAEWQDDYEYRRTPLWMANITYNWEQSSLQLLWIPDYEPNYGRTFGSAYFFPFAEVPSVAHFANSDKPSNSFKDHQWAIRYNIQKNNWELSFVYFYTWGLDATNFKRRFFLTTPEKGLIKLEVEPKYTRQHKFGFMAETSVFWFGKTIVISNELLYVMNNYYSVDDESLMPWSLQDGVKKGDDITFGTRWMTAFFDGELNVIVQPICRYLVNYDKSYSSPAWNQKLLYGALVVLAKEYEFTNNRLKTILFVHGYFNAHPSEQEGYRALFEVRWRVSDYITTKLYYEWFNGDRNGAYGSYDKYDNVGFYIKYEF